MTLFDKLVVAIAVTSAVAYPQNYQPLPIQNYQPQVDQKYPDPVSYVVEPSYDSYALAALPTQGPVGPVPATNLQLPKLEQAKVPFFAPENPNSQFYTSEEQPNKFQVPIPAQELRAPSETQWNPNNDPKYYYEVPAILTKQELPTNVYPKKFNKDVHGKAKPYASKPKQEIVLNPIDEKQYEFKQKNLNKVFNNLAKKENKKLIQVDALKNSEKELQGSATGFHSGFDSEGVNHHQSAGYTQGLSADITASLGLTSPHSSNGERLEFHLTGHDGPKSYKWGYDTGKGHNRQFRYEERDKTGVVKGHFGFYDKHGKLQLVHYDAQPHWGGFHVSEGN